MKPSFPECLVLVALEGSVAGCCSGVAAAIIDRDIFFALLLRVAAVYVLMIAMITIKEVFDGRD